MIVARSKAFDRDLNALRISSPAIADKAASFLIECLKYSHPANIYGVEKLKGTDNAYRYRINDYRLCFFYNSKTDKLLAARILHRKEVYRYFP